MGKKRRFLFAAVLVLTAVALTWAILRAHDSEPSYEGKPLSQYLDQLASKYSFFSDSKPLEAVYHMGPAAIPGLRRALRRKDSYYERSLRFLREHLPVGLARLLPATSSAFELDALACASAQCLGTFGSQARAALPDLIARFNDGFPADVAWSAVMNIGPQPENLPQLLAWLNSTNEKARFIAIRCIGEIGVANDAVLRALTNMAATGDNRNRRDAMQTLGRFGAKASRAIPVLTGNLGDFNTAIRIYSAQALWKIREKSDPPVAWFITELDDEIKYPSHPVSYPNISGSVDEHKNNLVTLIRFLAEAGSAARPAMPLLQMVRSETDIRLRLGASQALWKIAGDTNDYMQSRSEVLKDSGAFFPFQQMAAKELMEFCLEQHATAPQLEEMFTSTNTLVAIYGARALWKLKGETKRPVARLVAALGERAGDGSTPQVRQLAAETLAEIGDEARPAVPALLAALSAPYENIRRAATNAIKQIDPAAAAKAGVK